MELPDLYVIGGVVVVISGLTAVVSSMLLWKVRDYGLERRVREVEKQTESMVMKERSELGVQARELKAMEKTKAMVELGAILRAKEGDKKELLLNWASENPEFLLSIGKKFGISL